MLEYTFGNHPLTFEDHLSTFEDHLLTFEDHILTLEDHLSTFEGYLLIFEHHPLTAGSITLDEMEEVVGILYNLDGCEKVLIAITIITIIPFTFYSFSHGRRKALTFVN